MTVRRLRREMPQAEFMRWIAYFERKQNSQRVATEKAERKGQRRVAP
jgi:hypothetical protein